MKLTQNLQYLVLSVILTLCGCSQQSEQANDVIRIGTIPDFPPYEFIQDGEINGFDLDFIDALQPHFDKKLVVKQLPSFDVLLPELQFKHIEIVVAGLSNTPERSKRFRFTENYVKHDPLFIIYKNSSDKLSDLNALKNKTVIVIQGYQGDRLLTEQGDSSLLRLNNVAEGFLALKSNRGEALVTAQSIYQRYLQQHQADDLQHSVVAGQNQQYAMAVHKDNEDLQLQLNEAIAKLEQDGTLNKLRKKWGLPT